MKILLLNERLVSVEWLRGIASLGICEMHAFCALDFFSDTDTFFQSYIFPVSIAGRLGVAVFFVISGFIIPYSMWKRNYSLSGFFSFMTRRLVRLEPPYLLTILLSVLIAFITTAVIHNRIYEIDWFNLALHIGYLNVFYDNIWVNPVFWTLAIEFQFYILIGFLFPLLNSSRNSPVLLMISLLSAVISYLNPLPHFIFIHFQLFILGVLCFQKYAGYVTNGFFGVQVLINAGLVYHFHAKAYMVAALLSVLIIIYNVNMPSKSLHFLGKISYSLYLIHWVIGIELIRNVFVYYYPDSSEGVKIALAVFIILICTGLSALFYRIIEHPSIQWTKRLGKTSFQKSTVLS